MTLFIRGSNQNFIDYNSVKNTPNMVSDILYWIEYPVWYGILFETVKQLTVNIYTKAMKVDWLELKLIPGFSQVDCLILNQFIWKCCFA